MNAAAPSLTMTSFMPIYTQQLNVPKGKLRDKQVEKFSLSRWQQMATQIFTQFPMKCDVTRAEKCNKQRDEIKRQTEC